MQTLLHEICRKGRKDNDIQQVVAKRVVVCKELAAGITKQQNQAKYKEMRTENPLMEIAADFFQS